MRPEGLEAGGERRPVDGRVVPLLPGALRGGDAVDFAEGVLLGDG